MEKPDDLRGTKNLMGALVRMKPKPHEDMKVGKKPISKKNATRSQRSTSGTKK
jgi:hypothetical protein